MPAEFRADIVIKCFLLHEIVMQDMILINGILDFLERDISLYDIVRDTEQKHTDSPEKLARLDAASAWVRKHERELDIVLG